MDNTAKAKRIIVIVTCIYYLLIVALHLNYLNNTPIDCSGALLGYVLIPFVIIIPFYAIIMGIVGQIITRKAVFAPMVNTVGAFLFSIVFNLTIPNNSESLYMTVSFNLAVEAFIVTFISSGITLILQRLGEKKKKNNIQEV